MNFSVHFYRFCRHYLIALTFTLLEHSPLSPGANKSKYNRAVIRDF